MSNAIERRRFLKNASGTLLALPAAAALRGIAWGQAQPPTAQTTSGPHTSKPAPPQVSLSVKELGAVGDGKADDTLALQQTIDRCAVLGGGEVLVPAGSYLTGALVLRSNTTLHIAEGASLLGAPGMDAYPLTQVRWEGRWIKGRSALLSACDAENIRIAGPGKIAGSPEIRGRVDRATGLRLPALLEFTNCRNVTVENCATTNAGMWSIHPVYCEHIVFRKLNIVSGADGIDVDSCRHVVIEDCSFDTFDDCISLKSGRGEEGYTIHRPTEDVRISGCTFMDHYFACIGIGSETSAGIRGVRIERCVCKGARTHAIYIKSRPGRGAFIEDIFVDGFEVSGAQQGFLRLNTLNSGKQDEFPVPGDEGIPAVRNFHFSNIRVHDVPVLVEGWAIHPRKPLIGFSLVNVTGTAKSGITLANVKNALLRNIQVTGINGPLLSTSNVTGQGLKDAAKLDMSKLQKPPDPIATPAAPYKLH